MSQPTSDPAVTRASLLLRVRDPKDADAWNRFVEIYLPLIYRYCAKRGVQDAYAADIAQEVLRAVSSRHGRVRV